MKARLPDEAANESVSELVRDHQSRNRHGASRLDSRVIQRITPFMASTDIDKGQLWFDAIAKQLRESDYGIICLTKYNCTSPWLHYEGGALWKALGKSAVSPLLFDVDVASIAGPFAEFQGTTYSLTHDQEAGGKQQIWGLVHSLNNHLPAEERLPENLLEDEFTRWWPRLRRAFDRIRPKQDEVTQTAYDWLYAFEDSGARSDCRRGPFGVVDRTGPLRLRAQVIAEREDWRTDAARDDVHVLRPSGAWRCRHRESHCAGRHEAQRAPRRSRPGRRVRRGRSHRLRHPQPRNESAGVPRPAAEQRGFWIEVFAKGADGFYSRFSGLKKKHEEAPAAT